MRASSRIPGAEISQGPPLLGYCALGAVIFFNALCIKFLFATDDCTEVLPIVIPSKEGTQACGITQIVECDRY